ncbi:MAG: hypothetical protein ACTHOH_14050 [Lysobacteraceae bacterium]
MTTPRHRRRVPARLPLGLLALALAVPAVLPAQDAAPKPKLYCWEEGGKHVCGDAFPASAAGRARTEFDTRTGNTISRVGRALTAEERVQAAAAEVAQKAREDQARREMAMVMSYQTEDDLRRAFQNRVDLIEESLKGSELALVNLHRSLVSLLRQANELELQSKPVGKVLREKILTQHAELLALRALKIRQTAERKALDAELQQALSRYRELKGQPVGTALATPAVPATAPGG